MQLKIAIIVAALAFGAGPAFAQIMGAAPHALGTPAPAAMPQTAMAAEHPAHGDNPTARRATDALNLLESHGYPAFSNFAPLGVDFGATVSEGEKSYDVTIKPDTGEIAGR